MYKKLITTLAMLLILAVPAFATDRNQIIRVGISTNDFSKYVYNKAEFDSTNGFDVLNLPTGQVVSFASPNDVAQIVYANGLYTIEKCNKNVLSNLSGPLVIRPKKGSMVGVNQLRRGGLPAYYRGYIELDKSNGRNDLFSIVNVLDLQSYLKGVVPNEMPVSFGLEALKAQTVAARNYALRPRVTYFKEFDVCDSVACQVYFGANTEKELSNQAITQTNGIIALAPDDKLALALYSSTAGGYTENYELAFSDPITKQFPATPISYLKARPDSPYTKDLSLETNAREFFLSKPDSFDSKSPLYRWERTWDLQELSTSLAQNLVVQSKTGFVKPELKYAEDFGTLQDIYVAKRGPSGKIVTLAAVTDTNTYYISKELTIRRSLKKNGKALPSGNFVIDKIPTTCGTTITIHGAGFGHGVGLSQYGASGMSAKGYRFDQILQHYYKGVALTTNPIELSGANGESTASQEFYTTTQKAWICINNKSNIKNFKAIINGKNLNIDLSQSGLRKQKIDIKNYVIVGNNSIVYQVPTTGDKNKTVRVYIEVKEARND